MKLKNRLSYIRSLPEGKPPKERKVRITQLLYFFMLFMILAYLVQIGFDRWRHFSGQGRIEAEKTIVSSHFGGRLTLLTVQEGEDLKAGDPIAQIEPVLGCEEKHRPELDKLKNEIALKASRIEVLNEYLLALIQEADEADVMAKSQEINESNVIVLRRALEVGRMPAKKTNPAIPDNPFRQEKQKVRRDLLLLKKEITLKKNQRLRIENQISEETLSARCLTETIVAPFAARVQAVKRRENEFTPPGEAIVSLVAHNAQVQIDALFENKVMPYLTPDKQLEIIFPDGWRSQGRVMGISSPDYTVMAEDHVFFVEKGRQVRTRILPLNQNEGKRWLRYDRMEVRLRGDKKE